MLLENQIYGGNSSLLRGIFEEGVYLEYILKDKTRNRTNAYVISSKLKFLKIHETAKGDTPIGEAIRSMTGMEKENLEGVYRQITHIEKLKEEYKTLTGHDNPDKWYKDNNRINSLRDVCENLSMNQLAEYEIIYRLLSQEVHGKNSNSYFKIIENELVVANMEEEPLILPLMRVTVVKAGNLSRLIIIIQKSIKK